MTQRFQVDLAGMVDLLSGNLYSGPQVYLRELLQNAVDAVAARQAQDPAAPGRIRIMPTTTQAAAPCLEVIDTGIGLTADEATELLATIGRSSKRDPDFGSGRAEFIGQFGIGLLAAFMVADEVEVRSRSARPDAVPIRWLGRADGTFELIELGDAATAEIEIGTTMRLVARPDAEHWLNGEMVLGLARDFGSLLGFDVAVQVPVEGGEPAWRRISTPELPWQVQYPSAAARERALIGYCEETFGFTPLGFIDLDLPAAGVSGLAFVLPQAVSPSSGKHRIYLKRMLLGQRVDGVMPEWAFFTRAVLNAEVLAPTASREQVRDDETLAVVREALASRLREWALATLRRPTQFAQQFIQIHHLALRALALTDPQMLDLVAEVLPFETTDGPMPLAEVAQHGEILFTTTIEAYRRVAAVARAQGLIVVNAGYVYDADLLAQLSERPDWTMRELTSDDLVQILTPVPLERELEVSDALAAARAALSGEDCDVIVREFSPETVPALLLRDDEGERRRLLDEEREAAPELWGGLLDSFAVDKPGRSRTLVLNDQAAVVRRLLAAPAAQTFTAGLSALYLSAVMLAGDGLRAHEATRLSDALGVLLDASLSASTSIDPRRPGSPESGEDQ